MTTYEPTLYKAVALKVALRNHMKGRKPLNSSWTPKNMMLNVIKLTGKQLKMRDYQGAIDAIDVWIVERYESA